MAGETPTVSDVREQLIKIAASLEGRERPATAEELKEIAIALGRASADLMRVSIAMSVHSK